MQIVHEALALPAAIESARRIARSAFRSDALLFERYLAEPRHVEVQLFADRQGNVVHLLDRDCSVQRRHQKVIEEAPAPGVPAAVRTAMAQAAVTVARTVGYVGAGTVEFLLEPSGAFYFMEMNTRLQVEHPVTEAITGLDLVELQLRVASGEALAASVAAVASNGHAVEARIYAEDPANEYLPSVGRINHLRWPAETPRLRIDTGVGEGDEISSHYDPLIAKVIAHGATREAAVARLVRALKELRVVGVRTNTDFISRVLASDAFVTAKLSIRLLERVGGLEQPTAAVRRDLQIAAALWLITQDSGASESPWARRDAWRLNLPARHALWLRDATELVAVEVVLRSQQLFSVRIGGDSVDVGVTQRTAEVLQLMRDGRSLRVEAHMEQRRLHVWSAGTEAEFEVAGPAGAEPQDAAAVGALSSPLPGTVVALDVRVGDKVKARQTLVVVEAMKMEHSIRASADGTVTAIHCKLGERVSEGVALIDLGP
jgi:3-methylcrotonyl-CoA carboxylase alpha subunit